MGNLTYYLAASLDGYLARPDGGVDWLLPFQTKLSTPYDYDTFYRTVDAVVMGRKTWEVARSFEALPYLGKPCFVCSRSGFNLALGQEYVTPVPDLTRERIRALKGTHAGRIWLVGGAELASQLVEQGELDEILLTVVPVTIGSGIPWLKPGIRQAGWDLVDLVRAERGIVQSVYRRKA